MPDAPQHGQELGQFLANVVLPHGPFRIESSTPFADPAMLIVVVVAAEFTERGQGHSDYPKDVHDVGLEFGQNCSRSQL